jgi:prevent-host-death family protein
MKIAPVSDVKARFSKYLEDCVESPVVVTKNGRPTAVLVAVSDEEDLERLILAHTPRFTGLLEAASKRVKETGGVEHTEFWNSVGKKRRPQR